MIRNLCEESYKKIGIDPGCVNLLLESVPRNTLLNDNSLLGEVKKEEVIQAIQQLNVDKSPGPDGLPTEFYQLYIDEMLNLLTHMFNEGVHSGTFGDSFYEGGLHLIYKKGDKTDTDT